MLPSLAPDTAFTENTAKKVDPVNIWSYDSFMFVFKSKSKITSEMNPYFHIHSKHILPFTSKSKGTILKV